MKKLLLALLSALALFAVTSCEMTYGEGKYPELEQWFAPHAAIMPWYGETS